MLNSNGYEEDVSVINEWIGNIYWGARFNSSGGLEAPMRFELSASGLAEDRDAQVN